jgi:dihydroorotate dehydrogenase
LSRDAIYDSLIRPILFSMDPELVHNAAHNALHLISPLLPALNLTYKKDGLGTSLFGTRISNPIGLAAGFDKNGALVPELGQLGFGFAEIGSVCGRPHSGNPQPRLFRLPADSALINRLGLNGLGAQAVAAHLAQQGSFALPIGVNIAKTNDPSIAGDEAIADLVFSFKQVKNLPVKYITINTSCPNTAEGCLKESTILLSVLDKICAANDRQLPLVLKLSPDSSDAFIEELVKLSATYKLAGFVCGNTSTSREGLKTDSATIRKIGNGGLSGPPLKRFNLELTRKVARLKSASQVIIGVGGISSGQDAFDYLSAGAQLLQIYTGFVYRGPSAVKQICEELDSILVSKGTTLQQLQSSTALIS